ncbi:MAG TPA: FliM/FliN family flagellar motor switch protein [Candidatus Sulfotelmatobacter sp.]|nr:FliM/FliN family flagellar motor switch protein [Candidatus Sulfotelmatobacter sp.]
MTEAAVNDVEVDISVVLGKATMPVHQLLKMGRGAIIELDAGIEDHAWIFANNQLIARGEIVVIGENVAVSITETVRPAS